MSQTARVKLQKSRILAAYRRQNPQRPEFGPGGQTTPESVRAIRLIGQAPVTVMTGGLKVETLVPCGCVEPEIILV